MNRNRHGVDPRWSAAGAASVYNLRLPPKASGEDTGAGPAPGFMRLTPDSRAPAKADPWKVCVGCNPCPCSGGVVVVVAVVVVVVVVVVFCCCFCCCVVVVVVVVVGRCWPYLGAGLPLSWP